MVNVMRVGEDRFCFIEVPGHDWPEIVVENISCAGIS